MKKWEYKIIDSKDTSREGIFKGRSREGLEQYLNALGEEGWEIINIDTYFIESRTSFVGVAKREKQY